MKKISVLFLCVLVLLLGGLSSCELIEGAFGSNEKPSATPLENLIGTWKTEGYDERNFVTVNFGTGDVQARVAYVFSSGSIIFDRQVEDVNSYPVRSVLTLEKVDENYIYVKSSDSSVTPYYFQYQNGQKVLYVGTIGPLYKSN